MEVVRLVHKAKRILQMKFPKVCLIGIILSTITICFGLDSYDLHCLDNLDSSDCERGVYAPHPDGKPYSKHKTSCRTPLESSTRISFTFSNVIPVDDYNKA